MSTSSNILYSLHKIDDCIKIPSISTIFPSIIPYVDNEITKAHTKPPLIIFDVDDTLLDTSRISKKFPLFDGVIPIINFYQYVKDIGYHTVILTARPESKRDITIQNLNRLKIKDYDDIIFRTNQDTKYKFNQREKLSKNYTIIANIGSQYTDFTGDYNGKIINIQTLN
jgi:predicted secreted acid phosphatase